ncbi:MAG: tetratricopeptide repeat protein [Pyrinomonadaceae bacterium]
MRNCARPAGLLTAALAAIVFAASGTFAQGRSSISGFVFADGRTPVRDVWVELNTDLGSPVGRTRTDGSGRYFFAGVPFGRFTIRVLPLGTDLAEQSRSVEVGDMGVRGQLIPDNVVIDFYLQPRKVRQAEKTGVVFVQEVPDDARRRYDDGVAALKAGRTDEGVEQLRRAIEIFPTYFAALERLGEEYVKLQRIGDALAAFERAVAVSAGSFNAVYGLSYAQYSTGAFDKAAENAARAVTLNKSSASAHFILGLAQQRLGKYDDAERSLLQAVKLDKGKTPDIYWNLAMLYARNLRRFRDAVEQLERYLKATPGNPRADEVRKMIEQLREGRPPAES